MKRREFLITGGTGFAVAALVPSAYASPSVRVLHGRVVVPLQWSFDGVNGGVGYVVGRGDLLGTVGHTGSTMDVYLGPELEPELYDGKHCFLWLNRDNDRRLVVSHPGMVPLIGDAEFRGLKATVRKLPGQDALEITFR